MTKLTDASRANKSGAKLEEQLKSFLLEKQIPFNYQKPGKSQIDFIISDKIYADCTNQNVDGSVDEKLPHKIWKYYKQYRYRDVYIIRGSYIPGKTVIEHCEEIAKNNAFNFHILTLQEFCDLLENTDTKSCLEFFLSETEI